MRRARPFFASAVVIDRSSHHLVDAKAAAMKIRIGFELVFAFPQPTPLAAMLNVHPTANATCCRRTR